jgi:hypothetical protein
VWDGWMAVLLLLAVFEDGLDARRA